MLRIITACCTLALLPVAAHAAPLADARAKIAVPAGKMIPMPYAARTAKADRIACAPDATKASACHLRQAELRREQQAVRSADAGTGSNNQALD